jgi:hypothetical protein
MPEAGNAGKCGGNRPVRLDRGFGCLSTGRGVHPEAGSRVPRTLSYVTFGRPRRRVPDRIRPAKDSFRRRTGSATEVAPSDLILSKAPLGQAAK